MTSSLWLLAMKWLSVTGALFCLSLNAVTFAGIDLPRPEWCLFAACSGLLLALPSATIAEGGAGRGRSRPPVNVRDRNPGWMRWLVGLAFLYVVAVFVVAPHETGLEAFLGLLYLLSFVTLSGRLAGPAVRRPSS